MFALFFHVQVQQGRFAAIVLLYPGVRGTSPSPLQPQPPARVTASPEKGELPILLLGWSWSLPPPSALPEQQHQPWVRKSLLAHPGTQSELPTAAPRDPGLPASTSPPQPGQGLRSGTAANPQHIGSRDGANRGQARGVHRGRVP